MEDIDELVRGRRVLCVLEPGAKALDLSTASPRVLERFDASVIESGDLPFDDESFDTVGLIRGTALGESPNADLLDQCHRVLSDEGTLIVWSNTADDHVNGTTLERLHVNFPTFSVKMGRACWTTPDAKPLGDISLGDHRVVAVAHKRAPDPSDTTPEEPVDLRPFSEVMQDQTEIIERQRAQLAEQRAQLVEQRATLEAQERILSEQSDLLSRQESFMAQQRSELGSHISELSHMRIGLLDAERQLSRMVGLEAELAEALALADQVSDAEVRAAKAEKLSAMLEGERNDWFAAYEVVANSTSWKLTAPLRSAGRRLRRSRSG